MQREGPLPPPPAVGPGSFLCCPGPGSGHSSRLLLSVHLSVHIWFLLAWGGRVEPGAALEGVRPGWALPCVGLDQVSRDPLEDRKSVV